MTPARIQKKRYPPPTNRPGHATAADGRRYLPFLVVAAGVAVYSGSLSAPFLFDDTTAIVGNPALRHLWPPWKSAWAPATTAAAGRPTATFSLALNYAVHGPNVAGYHVTNIGIHVLAALVLFGIVRRTLTTAQLEPRYGRSADWLALAVALLWVVHPLQTQSVTYIIQRTESLMGLFYLLTLYCMLRGSDSPRPWPWHSAAVLSSALGMGSKETMITAPLAVLLYDRIFLAGSFRELFARRGRLYAGLAATWLVLAVLLATGSHTAGVGRETLTPLEYAATQGGVIVHYLRLCCWPHPLVVDYYDWPASRTWAAVAPSAAAVLTLLAATLYLLWRRPAIGFLGAWFFLTLAPTSSVLPLAELIAERRLYLPLAAVLTLVILGGHSFLAWLAARLSWPNHRPQRIGAVLLGAAIAALGALTVLRNDDFRTAVSIWTDTVAKRPLNARAHSNLGVALKDRGDTPAAIPRYREAVRLDPNLADPRFNLANALRDQGQLDAAIVEYREALRLDPQHPGAHTNLGALLASQGHLDEAIGHYRQALQLAPQVPGIHLNLAAALRAQGHLDEALAHQREAHRLETELR